MIYTIEPVTNGYRVMCGHLQLASFYHDGAERNAILFRAALIARDQAEHRRRDYVDYQDQADYIRQA